MTDSPSFPPDPTGSEPPVCIHCGKPMLRTESPPLSNFESPWFYVCFNDECGYFERGWKWMESNYGSKTSYRYKEDPFTGEKGPLPVWSNKALREFIIDKE